MQSRNHSVDNEPFTYTLMVETMVDFLEVAFHYILYIRGIYPRETFILSKAYGVSVWQNRHPGVKGYIAGLLQAAGREMKRGILQRLTFIIKSAESNLPLERFIFDLEYMDLSVFPSEADKDSSTLLRAPTQRQMKLMFQAFLTRLAALETGLTDNDPDEDLTYAVIITCNDEEPDMRPVIDYNDYQVNAKLSSRQPPYHPPEGPSLWAPATKSDGLHPSQTRHRSPVIPELGRNIGKGKGKAVQDDRRTEERRNTAQLDHALRNDAGRAPEGLRPIRSLETGVIDINLMVQETIEKANKIPMSPEKSVYAW